MDDPTQTGTEEKWLRLSFDEFDQTMDGGWRTVAHEGNYRAAARMIERYLERYPDLEAGQQRILHFHAGQMLAFEGDYPSAIRHLNCSYEDPERSDSPVRWNDYVHATIAFLENDRPSLLRYRESIASGPMFEGRIPNLHVADRLIEKFGEPYSKAY
jgi:hypothetical protein